MCDESSKNFKVLWVDGYETIELKRYLEIIEEIEYLEWIEEEIFQSFADETNILIEEEYFNTISNKNEVLDENK